MSMDLLSRLRIKATTTNQSKNYDDFSDIGFMLDEQHEYPSQTQNNLLAKFQPLPAYATIMGICEDGLPLVLDLNDPNPGAILITGGRHTGKSQLLRSILISACNSISIDQLYFYVITPEPGNLQDIRQLEHCYGIYSSYDKSACELVVELAALAEQRKSGRHLGVKCVLAIENLYEFIKHQDFEVINHLKWLYRFGASNGIWLISTIESERTNLIEPDLLNEQKTHILSGNSRWSLPDSTTQHNVQDQLANYRTRIGSEWVEFWLPSTNSN
jgi:hypothetical protein